MADNRSLPSSMTTLRAGAAAAYEDDANAAARTMAMMNRTAAAVHTGTAVEISSSAGAGEAGPATNIAQAGSLSHSRSTKPKCGQPGRQTFPLKLHQILNDRSITSLISWATHGRAWRVHDQKAFAAQVLPRYFKHSTYKSFTRQVNFWGFYRLTKGPDQNYYYHECFIRGNPDLCRDMIRKKQSDNKQNRNIQGDNSNDADGCDPDFYKMVTSGEGGGTFNNSNNNNNGSSSFNPSSSSSAMVVVEGKQKATAPGSSSDLTSPPAAAGMAMMPNAAGGTSVLLHQHHHQHHHPISSSYNPAAARSAAGRADAVNLLGLGAHHAHHAHAHHATSLLPPSAYATSTADSLTAAAANGMLRAATASTAGTLNYAAAAVPQASSNLLLHQALYGGGNAGGLYTTQLQHVAPSSTDFAAPNVNPNASMYAAAAADYGHRRRHHHHHLNTTSYLAAAAAHHTSNNNAAAAASYHPTAAAAASMETVLMNNHAAAARHRHISAASSAPPPPPPSVGSIQQILDGAAAYGGSTASTAQAQAQAPAFDSTAAAAASQFVQYLAPNQVPQHQHLYLVKNGEHHPHPHSQHQHQQQQRPLPAGPGGVVGNVNMNVNHNHSMFATADGGNNNNNNHLQKLSLAAGTINGRTATNVTTTSREGGLLGDYSAGAGAAGGSTILPEEV